MKTINIIAILMFALIVSTLSASAVPTPITFHGFVKTYDATGALVAVPSCIVTIDNSLGVLQGTVTTGSTGEFSLPLTIEVPEEYSVNFNSAGTISTSTPTLVFTGDTIIEITQTLATAPSGTVIGQISNTTPLMIQGATITLTGASTYSTTTIAGGAYVINNVLPGKYNITASMTDYSDSRINTSVFAGLTRTVDLILYRTLTITNILPSTTTSSATITWNTNVNSDSTVTYWRTGVSAVDNSLPALVTSHSIPINSLPEGTNYYYNVTSCSLSYCVVSGPYTFTTLTTPSPPSGGSSGSRGGSGGSSSTIPNIVTTTGPQTYTLDITKELTKTIRPIDSLIFDYQGTSYNLIVDKFRADYFTLKINPTNQKVSGVKSDNYDFTIKDKLLSVTIEEVNFNAASEGQSTIKLKLTLKDGMKQSLSAPVVIDKVTNGVIKVIGEIVPPKDASVPVGIGISVATLIVGLMLFLGLRLIWG